MKILDSDHCIAILRGQLNLQPHVSSDEELAVTVISIAELTHGSHKSSRPAENLEKLNVLLSATMILEFDEASARQFGELKAELERSGNVVADLDLQIASIVLTHDAILVTHNQKHFLRIPNLKLEDWL